MGHVTAIDLWAGRLLAGLVLSERSASEELFLLVLSGDLGLWRTAEWRKLAISHTSE